tara:strand:+ start:11897 stop:12718 length:822 start_codon:yes stop_codon:yes gene_type:complete
MVIFDEITIIFVTYLPDLNELITKLEYYKNFNIVIVDASPKNNKISKIIKLKNKLKIIDVENNGQGYANNVGIKSTDTKYGLYIDLDTSFEITKINKIYRYAKKLKNWSFLIPNSNNKYLEKKIKLIDNCEASIFFINIKNFKKYKMFDEKIFFYFEELDCFSRLNKTQDKVYLIPSINVLHSREGSIDKKIIEDINNIKQWHYLWSMYYVYKKNNNIIFGLKKVLPLVLKDFLKLIFYIFTFRFKLANKRLYRLSGALNSIFGRSSFKRPNF